MVAGLMLEKEIVGVIFFFFVRNLTRNKFDESMGLETETKISLDKR